MPSILQRENLIGVILTHQITVHIHELLFILSLNFTINDLNVPYEMKVLNVILLPLLVGSSVITEGRGGVTPPNIFKIVRKLVTSQPCCKRNRRSVVRDLFLLS